MASENFRIFKWDLARRRAAIAVADGVLSDVEIASEAGITDRQLRNWKADPVFAKKVQRLQDNANAELAEFYVTQKRQRMAIYQELLERQLSILFERADENDEIKKKQEKISPLGSSLISSIGLKTSPAGGSSGLIVRQVKQIGVMLAEEFAFDASLVKLILNTLEQIAKEAGQWETKVQHGGSVRVDHRHTHDLSRLSDDELAQLEVLAEKIELGEVAR